MEEIRADAGFSFRDLEVMVWERAVECYREAFVEALSALDKVLHDNRDPERYVLKGMRSREFMTKLGSCGNLNGH